MTIAIPPEAVDLTTSSSHSTFAPPPPPPPSAVSVEFCDALLGMRVEEGDFEDHVHFSASGYAKWLPTLRAQIESHCT